MESLFNKVSGLQVCNFIKKQLQQICFLVNIAKFLRTPTNIYERLLINVDAFWKSLTSSSLLYSFIVILSSFSYTIFLLDDDMQNTMDTTVVCDPDSCKNFGTCTIVDNNIKCHCIKGFRGEFCEGE